MNRKQFIGLLFLVLVLGGAGGGFAFWASAKEQARIQAMKDREIAEKQGQLDRLMAELKSQNDAIAQAQADAANAKSEADRAAATAKLLAAQEMQKKTQANIATIRTQTTTTGGGTKTVRPACTCQAGDPLCACL